VERIAGEKEARYRELVRRRGVVLLPGVAHWLARLCEEGWRQAVASSAPRANVETVLDALGVRQYFAASVSGEDVRHGKPAPDIFLAAAARLEVAPARCVVVEDAPAGVEAARRAGMHVIAVRSSHSSLAADLVVDTLEELPMDAFERLLRPAS
jgi:HAD superfamily hydrolase (TIGR01509 family)